MRKISTELQKKIDLAVKRLQSFEPPDGYYLAFSGGKDSQVIYHLAEMAGVKFDAHYTITTVDPPPLVYFIREHYPDVSMDYARYRDGSIISMWSLIVDHLSLPTKRRRFCCADLKEANAKGRIAITGVRWTESITRKNTHDLIDIRTGSKFFINRALNNNPAAYLNKRGGLVMNDDNDISRRIVETCYRTKKTIVNPIVDWSDDDVWCFLNDVVQVPHCILYDQGARRIGCIMCPMSGADHILEEAELHPEYKKLYLSAVELMFKKNNGQIKLLMNTKDVFATPEHYDTYKLCSADPELEVFVRTNLTPNDLERISKTGKWTSKDGKTTVTLPQVVKFIYNQWILSQYWRSVDEVVALADADGYGDFE